MKEKLEIKRINFLEHGRGGAITYKTMAIAIACWCALLTMLYGLQLSREFMIGREIKNTEVTIATLELEKEEQLRLIRQSGRSNVSFTSKDDLASIVASRPLWSKVLSAMVSNRPAGVLLEVFNVVIDKDRGYEIEIKGVVKGQRTLNNFLMSLESCGEFTGTALVSSHASQTEAGETDFVILTCPVNIRR